MNYFTDSYNNLRAVINNTIRSGGALRIYYINNKGLSSTRVVVPRGWENDYVFRAYCYSRKEERSFKLRNVLEWQYFQEVDNALYCQQNTPVAQPVAPKIYLSQTNTNPTWNNSSIPGQNPPIIQQIKMPKDWNKLISYYRECLI